MHDLTAFQRDLLRIIDGMDSPMGLGIKRELEGYYDTEINHGRLYPNLDTLVDKGLVSKEELDGRTNTYIITRRGRREIRSRDAFNKRYASEETSEAAATAD